MDLNLAEFIRFLEDHNLIEFDVIGNGDRQSINRLKLQKYVFLAKHFGMPFRYRYGPYLYGPYSSELAADYYALARNSGQYSRSSANLDGFRKDNFLKAIRNDPHWLEIATTIIDKNESTKERTNLVEKVCHIKSQFDKKFITGVLDDLEAHRLVTV